MHASGSSERSAARADPRDELRDELRDDPRDDPRDDLVAQLGRLEHAAAADPARLLGMVVALAGEVFVMKAQLERLSRAVQASGVDSAALLAAGETESMRGWLATEERAFTRAVLEPFLRGDRSLNATSFMREERQP